MARHSNTLHGAASLEVAITAAVPEAVGMLRMVSEAAASCLHHAHLHRYACSQVLIPLLPCPQAWAPPLQENARRNSASRDEATAASAALSSRDEHRLSSNAMDAAAAAASTGAAAAGESAAAAADTNGLGSANSGPGGSGSGGRSGGLFDGSAAAGGHQAPAQAVSLGLASPWPGQPGVMRALPIMRAFTFLRLSPEMTSPAYQGAWMRWVPLLLFRHAP